MSKNLSNFTSAVQMKGGGSYLIGLFATIGHLLDGHHLIGADVMGLTWRGEG